MRNIVLVGFMGTGKTSVGKLLAKKMKRLFLDLDDVIEKKEGISISEIFEKKGEPYFRDMEKRVVKEACMNKGVVISAGGGAIVNEENFRALKENGTIFCLKALPDTILKRTGGLKSRPLLNVSDPKKKIEELLAKREPYYNKADFIVDTDNLTVSQVVDKITTLIP